MNIRVGALVVLAGAVLMGGGEAEAQTLAPELRIGAGYHYFWYPERAENAIGLRASARFPVSSSVSLEPELTFGHASTTRRYESGTTHARVDSWSLGLNVIYSIDRGRVRPVLRWWSRSPRAVAGIRDRHRQRSTRRHLPVVQQQWTVHQRTGAGGHRRRCGQAHGALRRIPCQCPRRRIRGRGLLVSRWRPRRASLRTVLPTAHAVPGPRLPHDLKPLRERQAIGGIGISSDPVDDRVEEATVLQGTALGRHVRLPSSRRRASWR